MGETYLPKTFTVLVLLCTAITQHALGQITDNFTDGNFTDNPTWSGSTANYIVNASFQVRLNAPAAGTSYLSTPFSIPANHNTTWEFFLRQNFAASGSNHSRVYVMSSQADLSASLNGYFLQFGEDGANDAIKLFRQTGTTNTLVCAGPAATIAANPAIVKVRVTRDVAGLWVITADYTGGVNFVAVTQGTDNTHISSAYFGFRSTYTVTNILNFFYDDISITTEEAPDETAPTLADLETLSATEIELTFSENLDATTATNVENYLVNDAHPVTATQQADQSVVVIVLGSPLPNGHDFGLQITGVKDGADNTVMPIEELFLYFDPVESQKHDLTISEFYPDPNPSVGLPLAEFIEIYNRSSDPFDLAGWKITDGSSIGLLTTRILLPGEYITLCHTSDVAAFESYGDVMGLTTFPGLNNAGDTIKLVNPGGIAIDSLVYNSTWYHQIEDKQNGGWSLEKINPHDFCKGKDNWTPSMSPIGGTPGQQNAVHEIIDDVAGPRLIGVQQKDENTITLVFNENLNAIAPTAGHVMISPSMTISAISFGVELTAVDVNFTTQLDSAEMYSIKVNDIFDCPGNLIHVDYDSISFKLDNISPSLQNLNVQNDTTLQLQFSERVAENGLDINRFSLVSGTHPAHLIIQSPKILTLIFETAFINGVRQTLTIKNISDNAGNQMDSTGVEFTYFLPVSPSFKDVVISELFPDPAPTVGLPEAEFIEIFNRSAHPFNLNGWQITDGASVGVLPDKILLPNQYLILCPSAYKNVFQTFGDAIGLSVFPSLNNSTDRIKLIAPSANIIDSVTYELNWYHDTGKDDGGHSLEIINPNDFCRGANNWAASANALGGTPGNQNSIYSNVADETGPSLVSVIPRNAQTLSFTFDEKMNSLAPSIADIEVIPAIEISLISFGNTDLSIIDVTFVNALDSAVRYNISFNNITDCPGNQIQSNHSSASIKLDTLLPQVSSWELISSTALSITFSKRLNATLATTTSNFTLGSGVHPENIILVEGKVLQLNFAAPFTNGLEQTVSVANIRDVFDNEIEPTEFSFFYFVPTPVAPKDIVINELFPDPSPIVGLPEAEFVELFNRSANPIDLGGWAISDGSTTATLPSVIILPGDYLILCPSSKTQNFITYGRTIGLVTFPSLNNTSDTLVLKDPTRITIDSLNYSDDYYRDDNKREGGWTLERIDPQNICAEETNWIVSDDLSGGTPGKINSVHTEMPDLTGPILLSTFPENSTSFNITFNEKLYREVPGIESIQIMPDLPVSAITFVDKTLRSLTVHLGQPMLEGVEYSITILNIYDCAGNSVEPTTATFAIPQPAEAFNIVVNEILFNPRSTGVDFIEVYNNSDKFINLKNWKVANIVNDTIQNRKVISATDLLFYPHTFLVFTTDGPVLKGEYLHAIEGTFVETSLPSLPDDEGSVVLVDDQESVIDHFQYSADYHSVFLKDDEGVSLERIHFDQPTNISQNWKSASATVGFATPGYANSNSGVAEIVEENVNVQPEVFSPTGQQSFAEIHYRFDKGNLVANVKVMDAQGREVKVLADNQLLGVNGFLRWDGDTAAGSKARIGTYMIWFEVFDETGNVEVIKKRVVLAERF